MQIPEEFRGAFDLILADPNWSYQNFTEAVHGAAKNHYVCAGLDSLLALGPTVRAISSPDDAILGLWGTWPKADEHHKVYPVWGFEYVTGFPWVKVTPSSGAIRRGIGFWQQSVSEFMSVCRLGNPKRKKLDKQIMGLLVGEERQFYDRVRAHSEKPYGIHEWFEEMFPTARKAELFATKERAGWTCLGHKTGWHLDPSGLYSLDQAKELGLVAKEYDPHTWDPKRKQEESVS